MFEFLRQHQLTIMLFLSGICSVLALLCFFTSSMPKKRRISLLFMELYAALLLIMDRFAYLYRGDTSTLGWWMVRISNFSVYFFSLCIIHAFNLYLCDLFTNEGGLKKLPLRLRITEFIFLIGIICLIVGVATGSYYTFDSSNCYQRAPGFIVSYFFPFLIICVQFSVILQYYKRLVRSIRIPLLLFAIIPFIATIIQFFTYGLSLQNIALVGEVVMLYIFVLVDMNKTVERANKREVEFLKEEQKDMLIMFDQTATALANAIDAKDVYTHGHSLRVAEYSQKIAIAAGKDEKFCRDIYYAGLLHDVGKIGVPGSIINKEGKLSPEEFAEIKKHPVIGKQILSSISKSPYLSIAANSHHERYDGHGYPEGLKGDDIPEIARIIAVADSYDAMTSKRSYRDPIPQQKVREEIIKGMGSQFDPQFAKIMLHLIDTDPDYMLKEHDDVSDISGKQSLHCDDYRSAKSEGIILSPYMTKLHLHFQSDKNALSPDSIPSLILFDSLDARMHETEAKRRELLYMEYGSIRFDGDYVCGDARKFKVELLEKKEALPAPSELLEEYKDGLDYDIEAVRIKDHVLINLENRFRKLQFIIALPDSSHFCYAAITGAHCTISNFEVHVGTELLTPDYIPRIAPVISYINGPEGDIPSIQIDSWRSEATKGILLTDTKTVSFHTKSLPMARLIWHCPSISLFSSEDGLVNGRNFKEFVLIRLDGENWDSEDYATNEIIVNKSEAFEGWNKWKEVNKNGMDCSITLKKEGSIITVTTENAGISICTRSHLKEDCEKVYFALTGDQCVLTNIRIK